MTLKVRFLIVGMIITATLGLLMTAAPSQAGDSEKIAAAARKIGDMIKGDNGEGAKKLAITTVKGIEEISDLMVLFKTRNKGGLGVGEKSLTNPAKDGIEVMIRDLARDAPTAAVIAKQADAWVVTGYWIASMGDLSHAKGWPKDQGKKTKAAWAKYSQEMREAGVDFAKAATGKGAQNIKLAAAKANATCNNCHSIFKD